MTIRPEDEEDRQSEPLLSWMKSQGIPVTRESYLALAYPDGVPEEWTAELEAHLPECIRSAFSNHPTGISPSEDSTMRCLTPYLKAVDAEMAAKRRALVSRLVNDALGTQLPDHPLNEDQK